MSLDFKTHLLKPLTAKLICLAMFILFLGQLIFAVIPLFQNNAISTAPQTSVPVPEKKTSKQFLSFPLFGNYLPKNLNDSEIKQSMLDLSVVGIIFAEPEEKSQVILRTAGGEEKIFAVGDVLPGGVIIKRVTQNGIVVEHQGTLESLSFPKNELLFQKQPKPLIED